MKDVCDTLSALALLERSCYLKRFTYNNRICNRILFLLLFAPFNHHVTLRVTLWLEFFSFGLFIYSVKFWERSSPGQETPPEPHALTPGSRPVPPPRDLPDPLGSRRGLRAALKGSAPLLMRRGVCCFFSCFLAHIHPWPLAHALFFPPFLFESRKFHVVDRGSRNSSSHC